MEQNDDFGKSKGAAQSLISGIQFDIKLDEAKRDQLSPLKTAEKLLSDVDMQSFGKTIKLISAFQKFYSFIPNKENPVTWEATKGYAAIIQGYLDHPAANEFSEFHDTSETLKDVLMRILRTENIPMEVYLSYIPRVDKSWFLANIAEQTIVKHLVISGNQQEYDFEMQKSKKEIEESHKRVLASEALHETLMKD